MNWEREQHKNRQSSGMGEQSEETVGEWSCELG